MSQDRPVRLRDIADHLGLSVSTVSYAMRGLPEVAPKTVKRVRQAAQELGYRPSPAMGALAEYRRSRRSKENRGFSTMALVHSYNQNEWPGQANRRKVFEAISDHAQKLGYQLEVFAAGQSERTHARTSDILRHRGIRAVFLAPYLYYNTDASPVELDWSHFVAISLLNAHPTRSLHAVMPSWIKNRNLLVSQIEATCESHVGVYVTKQQSAWTGNISHTFLPYRDHLPVPARVVDSYDRNHFLDWFREYRPRIISTNLEVVPSWLREEGHDVPEEVGVIFIDTVQEQWRSGVDVQPERIGCIAVQLMHELVRNFSIGVPDFPFRLTVEGSWNVGATFDPSVFSQTTE